MIKIRVRKILLVLLFSISRIINWSFKNFLNRFFSLFSLGSSLCLLFSQSIKTDLIYVFLIASILSISVVRVSDNFILSLVAGHLSMSLLNPKEYRDCSYFKSRRKISDKLQKDFMAGIINASKYKKTLRLSTHGWFVNNVILKEEIISLFEVKILKRKEIKITLEVLCLLSLSEVFSNIENTLLVSMKKRKGYFVTLRK